MRYLILLPIFTLLLAGFFIKPLPAKASPSVPILVYHYIGNNPNPKDLARNTLSVPPDKFEAEMDYLAKNGYTPITLDTLFAIFHGQAASPAKPVVITFDDGYIDFYTTAFPILKRFNFHAVAFIPSGLIGSGFYMNWNQIKEIQGSGLVNFEGHSVSHANLSLLNSDKAYKELSDGKNVLNSQTGYPVNFIAYPYGAGNGYVQALAQKAGFVGGLGMWYGKATGISMNMPRIRITGQMDLKTFASKL